MATFGPYRRKARLVAAADRSDPSWEDFARELGHNLLRARMRTGMSQEKVAHSAGISSYTYQKFEKGESKPGTPMNPRLTTILALAQVLDTPVESLIPPRTPDLRAGRT